MHVQEMIETHPRGLDMDSAALRECIQECYDCAQTCTACADACLGEEDVHHLVHCIRLCLDCADICDTTGRVLSRQTEPSLPLVRAQLEACIEACRVCGDECDRHGAEMDMEHCTVCAEACRRCQAICERLLESVADRTV